jgi:Ig-like domain-containing protein
LQGEETAPTKRPKLMIWLALCFILLLAGAAQLVATWPTTIEGNRTDDASFVYDENIPDDTQVQPGQAVDKQWRIYNKGDTEWDEAYEARRADKVGIPVTHFGPDGFKIPHTLPGHDSILSKRMTAPPESGCYRNTYQLYHDSKPFGEAFEVQLVVVDPKIQNYALWIDHANVRDGTNFPVNAQFKKGWTVHNCGTNTWINYRAVRVAGDLTGPAAINIPATGGQQDVTIWADFTAPSYVTDTSTATYKLEDADGNPINNVTVEVNIKSS